MQPDYKNWWHISNLDDIIKPELYNPAFSHSQTIRKHFKKISEFECEKVLMFVQKNYSKQL